MRLKNAPGDPGQFVGQRNRQHIAVQPLFGGFNPGLEPVALPALGLDQCTTQAACTNRTRR